MKVCSKCKKEKSKSDFSIKVGSQLHSYCKLCMNAYSKRYYRKSPVPYRERTNRRKNQIAKLVQGYKNVPCMDCGKSYPYYVMDMDHRHGVHKKGVISLMVSNGADETALLEEVAKCDVVCANCHRERTHQRSKEKFDKQREQW